jgi:hypothetical protein
MLTPGRVLAPLLWGAVLLVAGLVVLAGRVTPESRTELAWHAGAAVVMAAMQFAMAGGASAPGRAGPVVGGGHDHGGAALGLLLVAAVLGLVVAAVRHVPRARRNERGIAPYRHPLMAVAMLAMLAAMPAW